MKKTMKAFIATLGLLVASVSGAYAVPTIDGLNVGAEWANNGTYPYYLEVFDVDEPGVPQAYDISHAVLFQELNLFGGDGDAPGLPAGANDGVYILIEVYGLHPSIIDLDGTSIPSVAGLALRGDFDGNGTFEFFINHKIKVNPDFTTDASVQSVLVTNLAATDAVGNPIAPIIDAPLPAANWTFIDGNATNTGCASFSAAGDPCFDNDPTKTVIEYFIPSTGFGTPLFKFPFMFIGSVFYDNGGEPQDDEVRGTLIPEPGTMLLFGSSLLGMLGAGKFGRK